MVKPNLPESIRWRFFNWLNRLSDFLRPPARNKLNIIEPATAIDGEKPLIWVFCSTIGEFNACKPLLDRLAVQGKLVFLSDHGCYAESYIKRYPDITFVELSGRVVDGEVLVRRFPPEVMVVCEIPAFPNEAPCRLSYAVLRAAKLAGARIYLVNAWLYGYDAACRMDRIERRWFATDYIKTFDHMTVQTEAIQKELLARGVDSSRISISGNMKFDALKEESRLMANQSVEILQSKFQSAQYKVLVAGCLASLDESRRLLEALRDLRKIVPGLYPVLAPRHPENEVFMKSFLGLVEQSGFTCQMKSKLTSNCPLSSDMLIVDTFGELKNFYAMADVCYVGCNHNILEPLCFGKPIVISGNWDPTYPSYPVYQLTRERSLVNEAGVEQNLTDVFAALLNRDAAKQDAASIQESLHDLSGAVDIIYNSLSLPESWENERSSN